MTDFSQPEYASYVALCRELKLEPPDTMNSEGASAYIHGHHRTSAILRAGIRLNLTHRHSKKAFVMQLA